MCTQVYLDGKFVGGALTNWYGKLAPVVDQCFDRVRNIAYFCMRPMRRSSIDLEQAKWKKEKTLRREVFSQGQMGSPEACCSPWSGWLAWMAVQLHLMSYLNALECMMCIEYMWCFFKDKKKLFQKKIYKTWFITEIISGFRTENLSSHGSMIRAPACDFPLEWL